MKVKVNQELRDISSHNLAELALELGLPERGVAMAINNKIAPRMEWESTLLSEEDSITVIKAAFGG